VQQDLLNSLEFLSKRDCLKVYGFVIMPNHIHIIWQPLQPNGKESPIASFSKFTSNIIIKKMKSQRPDLLPHFGVDWSCRQTNIWQPFAYSFELLKTSTIRQKLNYIHNNPLQEHWRLAKTPTDYRYSSAKFDETAESEFSFLKHYEDYY